MELEELKNRHRGIKAPSEPYGGTMQIQSLPLDSLVEKLKQEDAKQLNQLKRAKPLWWFAAALWMLAIAGTVASGSGPSDPGFPLRIAIGVLFCGLALALLLHIKKLSAIDYAEPTARFLQKAVKRYQFMTTPQVTLAILICAILASALSFYSVDLFKRYLGTERLLPGILAAFAWVASVLVFGYVVSKKAWKKTKEPILREIERLQHDLRAG